MDAPWWHPDSTRPLLQECHPLMFPSIGRYVCARQMHQKSTKSSPITNLDHVIYTVLRGAPPRRGLLKMSVSLFLDEQTSAKLKVTAPSKRPEPAAFSRQREWSKSYAHPDGVTTPNAQSPPSFATTWLSKTGVITTLALARETQRARTAANFILAFGN